MSQYVLYNIFNFIMFKSNKRKLKSIFSNNCCLKWYFQAFNCTLFLNLIIITMICNFNYRDSCQNTRSYFYNFVLKDRVVFFELFENIMSVRIKVHQSWSEVIVVAIVLLRNENLLRIHFFMLNIQIKVKRHQLSH